MRKITPAVSEVGVQDGPSMKLWNCSSFQFNANLKLPTLELKITPAVSEVGMHFRSSLFVSGDYLLVGFNYKE